MDIQIGGTYSASRGAKKKTFFVKVLEAKENDEFLCVRIDNDDRLTLKRSQFRTMTKKGESNGQTGQSENGSGLQEPTIEVGLPAGTGAGSNEGAGEAAGAPDVHPAAPEIPEVKADLIREGGELNFNLSTLRTEDELAVRYSFWTDCGRFMICSVQSKLQGGENHVAVWGLNDAGGLLLVSDDHRSIKSAAKAAVEYLAKKGGLDSPGKVNASELTAAMKEIQDGPESNEAFEKWLEGGRQPYQVEPPDFEETEMSLKVKEKAGIDLMVALGYKATSSGKLQNRLEKIEDYGGPATNGEVELTKDQQSLFDSLRKAVADGKGIEVVPAAPDPEPKKDKKKGEKAKTTAKSEMSLLDAAEKVLKETKKESLTAGEIIERILNKGYWKPVRAGKTPHNTLSAHVRADKRFKRVGRGQIALD